MTLRGGWTGLRLPGVNGPVTLNGKTTGAAINEGVLLIGRPPAVHEVPWRSACLSFQFP